MRRSDTGAIIRNVGLERFKGATVDDPLDGIANALAYASPEDVTDTFGWKRFGELEASDRPVFLPDRSLDIFWVHRMSPKFRAEMDDASNLSETQAEVLDSGFADRIRIGLGENDTAWLVRNTGLPKSTIYSVMSGTMPKADTAARIARTLGRSVEWLVSGENAPTEHSLIDASAADWVFLPHYRLADFTEYGKPEPIEKVPMRRDWLNRAVLTSSNLWLTTMPSGALPQIAAEGDTIVCKDVELPLADGRIYIWFLSGRPIVRRLQIRPRGNFLMDDFGSGTLLEPHEIDDYVPVARVLASIAVRPA